MIYLLLLIEFLTIGVLSIGGGLATLPFLITLAGKYDWFSYDELINMIAISESTPGPIGINLSTFAGYQVGGLLGGIIASVAVFMPGVIVMLLVARSLKKLQKAAYYNDIFYGLRPAVLALISFAAYLLILTLGTNFSGDLKATVSTIVVFLGSVLLVGYFKKSPILVIFLAGLSGIILSVI